MKLLLENLLEEDAMLDSTMELVFETCGTRDGVTVELVKKEEDGVTVELMKMGTDVVFTDEYTGLIEVTEINIVVVLLAASIDLDEVSIRVLLENPLEEDTKVDWIVELLFDTCGTRDEVKVELMRIEADVVFTEEYTGLIDVMELNIFVVVLLTTASEVLPGSIELLL